MDSTIFHKSSFSELECVEVGRRSDGSIAVRNSRERDGSVQVFSGPEWSAFIAGVKNGEFDFAPTTESLG